MRCGNVFALQKCCLEVALGHWDSRKESGKTVFGTYFLFYLENENVKRMQFLFFGSYPRFCNVGTNLFRIVA